MFTNEIVELLRKYDLVDESTNMPSDWDENYCDGNIETIAEEIFAELLEDKQVFYALDIGGWDDDDLVGEFANTIIEYIEASNDIISINNFKTSNPVDENGDIDEDEFMTIEFDHDNNHYHWEFTLEEPDVYFREITKWAEDALDGNVLFFGDESFVAYCIPRALVNDLEQIGIKSKSDYFG
jgi:hypothetical protein